jgi:hypothetical protein
MYFFQRYAHIFWIPFVPTHKKAVSECTNCRQVLEKKEFPLHFKNEYEDLKFQAKTPLWTFAGLGILAVVIVLGIISSNIDDAKNADLIFDPKKGDIYEMKLSATEYTLYKVDKVEGNAVYLFENEFVSDRASGVTDLYAKPFYKESTPLMKTNLKAILKSGEIMDIDRD